MTEYKGKKLSRGVRPACMHGYCCGSAVGSDGGIVETCQTVETSSITYFPTRPKNATARPQTEVVDFACIDGAKKIAAAAVAFLTTAYVLL